MKTNEDLQKMIARTRKAVNCLPIEKVLQDYGVQIERESGSRLLSLCPFNPHRVTDLKLGSFSIDKRTNTCHCYACNKGGGVVTSIANVLIENPTDEDMQRVALQLARDYHIIGQFEYELLTDAPYVPHKAEKVERRPAPQAPEKDVLLRDKVYRAIKARFPLTEEHKKHLREERHLDALGRYFSMPKTFSKEDYSWIMNKAGVTAAELGSVPGFVLENGKPLVIIPSKGIGILITDAHQKVSAIQVRSDDPEAEVRYKFFSYTPSKSQKIYTGGGSVSNPPAVLYPKKYNGYVAVVEGIFKAEVLRKKGFLTIAVQGVNSIAEVPKLATEALALINKAPEKFAIFYDADFLRNDNVAKAAYRLGESLEMNFPGAKVRIAVWDPDDGKGIDDLVFHGKWVKKCQPVSSVKDAAEKALQAANAMNITMDDYYALSLEERIRLKDEYILAYETVMRELL